MRNAKSKVVKAGIAIATIVVLDVTAALAQSSSRSRYNYEYSTPSDQHHWSDRNSADFNT